jgi:hypothetical protein
MLGQLGTLISDRDDHVKTFFVMAGDELAVRTIDGYAMLLPVFRMDEDTLASKVCHDAVKGGTSSTAVHKPYACYRPEKDLPGVPRKVSTAV